MFIEQLKSRLGYEKVTQNKTELFRHSHDESYHQSVMPEVVCFPECTEDIAFIMEVACTYNVPVTPYGAGSGLEGQAIPIKGGISVSFERMNQILDFSPEDLTITVQPGVTRSQLNKYINRNGLLFPIDPGADASIGGMVATNASGTTAVKYGSMRDQILDLEVVLANGTIIHTGTRAKKSSSGYHLTGLFTGSEGTLGIITEVTIKLHGILEHSIAARCTFDTPEACCEAAQILLLSGIPIMRMELVDKESIAQVNDFGGYSYPVAHSLFFEFSGTKVATEEEATLAEKLMTELGCNNWEVAADSNERKNLWRARVEMSYAYRHQKGKLAMGIDVCVPISKMSTLVAYARDQLDQSGLDGGIFGHIGDGNFHTLIVFNPSIPGEQEKASKVSKAIALVAIDVGGTCTGEHGVGLGKMEFQKAEHGQAVEVMKSMKNMLDPGGLLNPLKMFL